MALTITKMNDPYAGVFYYGAHKIAFCKISWSATADTYTTDGEDLSQAFEQKFGIRWVDQIVPMAVLYSSDESAAGMAVEWDASTQKLIMYVTGTTTTDPPSQLGNGTAIGPNVVTVHAMVFGRS